MSTYKTVNIVTALSLALLFSAQQAVALPDNYTSSAEQIDPVIPTSPKPTQWKKVFRWNTVNFNLSGTSSGRSRFHGVFTPPEFASMSTSELSAACDNITMIIAVGALDNTSQIVRPYFRHTEHIEAVPSDAGGVNGCEIDIALPESQISTAVASNISAIEREHAVTQFFLSVNRTPLISEPDYYSADFYRLEALPLSYTCAQEDSTMAACPSIYLDKVTPWLSLTRYNETGIVNGSPWN